MATNYYCSYIVYEPLLASMLNNKRKCGNYDGDDDEVCDDFDEAEELEMMFDEEDLEELREG